MEHKTLADLNILSIGTSIQLSGAVYSDADKTYLVVFPDEHDAVDKPLVSLKMTQAEWVTFIQQTDHLDVEMLAPGEDGKMVKSIVRKSQRQIDQGESWKVYQRDGYRCSYCGMEGVPLTVDHLVCWEEGGPSIAANLLTACRKCNKTRGNLPYKQWLQHPYYLKVSRNLIEFARLRNEKLVDTLAAIPRQKVRSR